MIRKNPTSPLSLMANEQMARIDYLVEASHNQAEYIHKIGAELDKLDRQRWRLNYAAKEVLNMAECGALPKKPKAILQSLYEEVVLNGKDAWSVVTAVLPAH